MAKRARHQSTTHDLPHKKHKVLDLRSNERFEKYNCHKFVFKVDSPPIDITTHTTTSAQEEKKIHHAIEIVLREGLDFMANNGIPPYAIIHIYLHCTGMDQDFMFCASGPERVTLQKMREGQLSKVINQFESVIQSGKNVTLDDHTVITYYAFIPPTEYR